MRIEQIQWWYIMLVCTYNYTVYGGHVYTVYGRLACLRLIRAFDGRALDGSEIT